MVEGLRKNGEVFPLELAVTEVKTESNEIYFAGILRDVTAAQKLRHYELIMSSVLRTTVDAVVVINQNGIIEMFNQAAEKMFRYSERQVVGKNVSCLMPEPYASEHGRCSLVVMLLFLY